MVNVTPNTKQEQDDAYSPEERARQSAKELHESEQQQAFNRDFENPERLAKDGTPGDLAGGARKQEEDPGYVNNVSKATKVTAANFRAVLKRKGPSGFIIALIMGGGLGGLSLGGLGLLPFHIAEQFLSKYDTQNTSMTIRTNKLIANKLSSNATSGTCSITLLPCRFERPSNKLLRNMEANGITAYDKNGVKIEPQKGALKGSFKTTRPVTYKFEGKPYTAEGFTKQLRTNDRMRAAFHRAYNPRFITLNSLSTAFKAVKARIGFDGRNSLKATGDTGNKPIEERLNEKVAGTNTGARAAIEEGAEKAGTLFIKKLIGEKIGKVFETLSHSGKGSAATLIAAAVCAAKSIPQLIAQTARAYQLVQLIRYGAAFMNLVYAMKAGDATSEDAAFVGDLLTKQADGKSPMSAFGMKYTLFDDVVPENDNYKKFQPGGNVISALAGTTQITESQAAKDSCAFATNPVTGVALNAALVANSGETLGVTALAAAANYVIGWGMSELISSGLPVIVKTAQDLIPDEWAKTLLGFFLGDLTQNLVGEPVGNALPAAVSHELGQVANAGGLVPLTRVQKLAYDQTTKEVQLAYAKEDRATLSPFDASSPNTFLGSILNQFLPYYDKLSSITGMASMIGSIVPHSLGAIVQPAAQAAGDPSALYSLCPDPALENIAAGYACNPYYGIPTKYLEMDPSAVMNALINSNDIDELTGEPVDHDGDQQTLQGWLSLCGDGSTDNIQSCIITDEDTPENLQMARFAIYTGDHLLQQAMDEEVDPITVEGRGSGSPITDSADPRITTVVNKTHPNVPLDYAPTDLKDVGGKLLRAEAATAFSSMSAAAKADGKTLIPVSGYRSYSAQVDVYAYWKNELGKALADIRSAQPGFSEHQTGLAMDINTDNPEFGLDKKPEGIWLAANSWKYGFILRYPDGRQSTTGYVFEPWHFRYIGVKAATDMHNKGITTLEEYYKLGNAPTYAYNPSVNNMSLLSYFESQNTPKVDRRPSIALTSKVESFVL